MNAVSNFALILVLSISFMYACQNSKTQEVPAADSIINTNLKKEKLLRHVVIFKFNDDSSKADVDRLNNAFNALADSISVIKDFEWGLNDSPEDFHQDFTHCYLLTFDSEEDRDSIYAPHPQHKAFVESLGPHLEKVFVVDYWTNP